MKPVKNKYDRKKATLPTKLKVTPYDVQMLFPEEELPKEYLRHLPDETLLEKLPEWLRNFKVSYDTIGFNHSVAELPEINGSAIVVDKSMASTTFFKHIQHLKNYKGTLIVCDRALAQTLKHRIPQYVCQLDSSYLCQYFFDLPQVKRHMQDITAVFSVTTHPLTIRLWNGKRVFFTPWLGNLSWNLAVKSHTPVMSTGGEVSTFAWLLALNLSANPIGMFGIYNAYNHIGETEYPGLKHYKVKNRYGTFVQDPVYRHYAKIHKAYIKFAKEKYGVQTYNLTQGGAMYSKWIKDLSLKEFVNKFA